MNIKRALLDLVKDHPIPHVVEKITTNDTYDALVTLCQSANISRMMLVTNKLTKICMCKIDAIASYQMTLPKLRDQFGTINGEVKDDELVWITLNGFRTTWHNFDKFIYGQG